MRRIAYLVSDYHAPSHTFVRREITGLRALGIDIIPFSVRPGASGNNNAEPLLGRSPTAYVAAIGWALLKRPRQFMASWRLALTNRAPGFKALLWSQFHFVEAVLLARLLLRTGATHLHNHFANSGATVGMIAARVAELPWSLTLHGISETDYPAGLLLAEKLNRASFVACASYFMRAQAMRFSEPSCWSKMSIVRCGIDIDRLPSPGVHGGATPARLICVGRLSPEKGHFGLLEALSEVAASNLEFELTLVGDGSMLEPIRARAKELDLLRHIRFTGALSESETLAQIAQSDILVLPSLMEGLPVVLIEAMALGRPVVASRVAGIPELIDEGQSGFMFTPSDWQDLATALSELLVNSVEWQRMGQMGCQRVEEEFRSDISAARMARLFASVEPPCLAPSCHGVNVQQLRELQSGSD